MLFTKSVLIFICFEFKPVIDIRYDVFDSIMCAAVSTDGDALFKIDELSLTISTESNISNYSLTSTSFKCAPDFPSCRQPYMRSIDDILALGRYYNQTWRPGEVACSIIGSYIADSPILPIMYEQEEKVN